MMLFAAVSFAFFGAIVGSFLNVLVLRKGVKSLWGRSECPSCGRIIAWYDNIPVVSWLILRRRCRSCGSRISAQYPLVEAVTATLFAFVGAASPPDFLLSFETTFVLAVQLVIVALLVAITVYDLRHTIIPDEWSYGFSALALLVSFLSSPTFGTFISGPLCALPLFLLWLVSHGRWMGLGDPKLALGIGWLLGLPLGLISVFSSFVLGSVVLLPLLAYERLVTHTKEGREPGGGLTMKREVPFGPFLIASCFMFWLAQLYGVALPLYWLGI